MTKYKEFWIADPDQYSAGGDAWDSLFCTDDKEFFDKQNFEGKSLHVIEYSAYKKLRDEIRELKIEYVCGTSDCCEGPLCALQEPLDEYDK